MSHLPWYGWVVIALLVANVVLTIVKIDEPRRPLTRTDAVVVLIVNTLLVWAVVALAQH